LFVRQVGRSYQSLSTDLIERRPGVHKDRSTFAWRGGLYPQQITLDAASLGGAGATRWTGALITLNSFT